MIFNFFCYFLVKFRFFLIFKNLIILVPIFNTFSEAFVIVLFFAGQGIRKSEAAGRDKIAT
jgi:hypothetical protein